MNLFIGLENADVIHVYAVEGGLCNRIGFDQNSSNSSIPIGSVVEATSIKSCDNLLTLKLLCIRSSKSSMLENTISVQNTSNRVSEVAVRSQSRLDGNHHRCLSLKRKIYILYPIAC
ncbi:hypothetical protein Plhal304r1_c017g0061871 [Plasmopara halstedii]